MLQKKVHAPDDATSGSPITSFIAVEQFNAIQLVQHVHASLASLAKVIKGTQLLTPAVESLAMAIMRQEVPDDWFSRWTSGPDDPMQWLRALVSKTVSVQTLVQKCKEGKLLSSSLDLASLFHPDTFLNALRQETARSVQHVDIHASLIFMSTFFFALSLEYLIFM